MLVLLSLFACSPSDATGEVASASDTDGATFEQPAPAELGANTLSGEREAAALAPVRVEVQLPAGTTDGFLEVRPYRADGSHVEWVGRALVTHAVEGTFETLTLPAEAPRRDRLSAEEPVVYAIAFRHANARTGKPGVYAGVADTRLVHVRADAPDGAALGWNLAAGYDGDREAFLPVSETVDVEANVLAHASLTLAGESAFPLTADTRIAVSVGTDAGAEVLLDQPASEDWDLTVSGSPTTGIFTTLGDDDAPVGTDLFVFAYEDTDGDGLRGPAAPVAGICSGAAPAVLSWYEPAHSLADALRLADHGVKGGWDVARLSERGAVGLTEAEQRDLVLDATCD